MNMERGPPASRLQAPAAPAKRGSGGGAAPHAVAPFGLRRATPAAPTAAATPAAPTAAATRRSTASPRREDTHASPPPPRLALHELHNGPPPPTAHHTTFLRRGSGRTIATLGANAAAMTPPPPASTTRRRSGGQSPRAPTVSSANGTVRPTTHNGTPLRTRHGSRDAGPSGELLEGNKTPVASNKKASPPKPASELVPLSPESSLRQRKRSADMMDPHDPAFRALQAAHTADPQHYADEVDEPPLVAANGHNDQLVATGPMTPPPRTGTGNNDPAGAMLPMSPRDPKRQKRLTRSPKTPLGLSNYESEEGGLSATQRVRLSLSGYMSIASLTGMGSVKSVRRESGADGTLDSGMLLANGDGHDTAASTNMHATARSAPPKFNQSVSSLARSKFAASRSMSGSQMASALLPTKNAVDCLMGYIRELQRSEALLRVQLEKVRKQRHEELSRSTVLVTTLESERERERRELEEQQRMIYALKAEVAELHDAMSRQAPIYAHGNGAHETEASYDNGGVDSNGYANEASYCLPASSYVTPPPSGSGDRQFPRAQQQSSYPESASYGQAAAMSVTANGYDASMAPLAAEWTEEQAAYYQSQGHYQYQDPSTMGPTDGYVPADYNTGQEYYQSQQDASSMQNQDTAQPGEWTEQRAHFGGGQDCYDYASGTYPVVEPPSVPMSPVAKLNNSWSPHDSKGVQPQIEVPPPMFRVAPRLSDIISPLSRSVIAASVAADHNVLKPVTPQALSGTGQPRAGEIKPNAADQAFMMTPPPLGPPAFSMSGFHSGSERESTPPPSSKPKRQNGVVPNPHAQSVPDHVPRQEEQFVPAEQVFKSFHKPKTPNRKASTTPSKGVASMSKEALKALLIEFFTAVDKTKLRMVEGYSRRYQGEETKLLNDLTKKYGAQKVAELKRKFENASNPFTAVENGHPPLYSDDTAPQAFPTPPVTASSPVCDVPPPVQEACTDTTQRRDEAWDLASVQTPADSDEGGQPPHATPEQNLYVSPPTPSDELVAVSAASASQMPSALEIAAPPLDSPPPSQKVSPNGARRGPPLPFAFEDSYTPSQDEVAPEMLPPPQVSVAAPPRMMSPPLAPQSPTLKAVPSPPRLAPSPPRAPPPSERSPARNGSVLRQRVSPQRQTSATAPPLGPPPMQPLRQLSMNTAATPPKPNAAPVTLEGLLVEFYRKHQPDHVKNVPELVKMYTGKEREMVSLLKKKYGALSIKRLEQYLAILEQQTSAAGGANSVGESSQGTTPGLKEKKAKSRGCFGRVVFFLLKLILIRVIVTLVLFGGLVALDHSKCQHVQPLDEGIRAGYECQKLSQDVQSFQMSHLTAYVQRMESRECFCEQWRLREATMSSEPSVGHAVDLVKLVPFSRTIAEPAWLEFVDSYLPNLTYNEYYRSYATPAFLAGKEYALVGAEHAKQIYTEAVANMPEMPWREAYESHGKRMIKTTSEYGKVAIKHVIHAYTAASAIVADQRALLVEMYNEEADKASHSMDSPPADSSKVVKASVDALTKAAKASKALAEPHEVKDEDVSSVRATEYEVPSPHEQGESDGTHAVDGGSETTDAAQSLPDFAPVEVVIEQAGLDLSYSGDLNAIAESSEPDEEETRSLNPDEPVDVDSGDVNVPVVDETHVTEETMQSVSEVQASEDEDVATAIVELVDESRPANPEQSADTDPVLAGEDERASITEPSLHDDVEVSVERSVEVEQHVEVESVMQEERTEQHDADHGAAAVPAHMSDDAQAESVPAVDELEESVVNHPVLESLDTTMGIDTTQPTETVSEETREVEQASLADVSAVLTSSDSAGTITEPEAVVATEVSETDDGEIAVNEQPMDLQGIEAEQAVSEDVSSTGTVSEEVASTNADHADDDLSFLEDLDGLDSLELLDLADMAAAELHSIN